MCPLFPKQSFYGPLIIITKLNNRKKLNAANLLALDVETFSRCQNVCLALINSMICHKINVSIRKGQGCKYLVSLKGPRVPYHGKKVGKMFFITISKFCWPTTLSSVDYNYKTLLKKLKIWIDLKFSFLKTQTLIWPSNPNFE